MMKMIKALELGAFFHGLSAQMAATKEKADLRRLDLVSWCPGEDSNLHGVTR